MLKNIAAKNNRFEPKIVVIGGGTGLSVLLRGLKEYTPNITAIVTVSDDGGSSGTLRKELGVPPPGDIRNCLVALSEKENLMAQLFQYRFPHVGSLSGHSFGNLFLTAMSALAGSFDEGIAQAGEVLAIRGKVLPATLSSVTLEAEMLNGKIVKGESNISKSKSRVVKLKICPALPPAAPKVLEAIKSCDCIVLGPGSLYTSVIANLLIKGIVSALKRTKAPKIYICNIMTQANETKGFSLNDHIEAIYNHAGGGVIDYILLNTGKIPGNTLKRYSKENSFPVIVDKVSEQRIKIVKDNFIFCNEYVRHNPERLSRAIIKVLRNKEKNKKKY
jgi:uncharacterized cofD-like protein